MACTYLSIMVNFFASRWHCCGLFLDCVWCCLLCDCSLGPTRYHTVGPTRARIGLYKYSGVLCSSHLCRAKFLDLVVRVRDIQVILSRSTLTMRALYHLIVWAVVGMIHSHSWWLYQVPGTYLWYQVGTTCSKHTAGTLLATVATPGTLFPVGIKANHGTR